jgi:hypothetical protein
MRGTMRAASVLVLLVIFTSGQAPREGKNVKPCTTEDSIRADAGLASLKTWADVYRAYMKFAQCDQGSVAEGYSDSVARLLSEKWDSADELNRICSRNRGFEKFVLRHVDELMTPQQARTVRKNARSHCPRNALKLCRQIVGRINALEPLGR